MPPGIDRVDAERLTGTKRFRVDALAVTGIDNSPVVERFGPDPGAGDLPPPRSGPVG